GNLCLAYPTGFDCRDLGRQNLFDGTEQGSKTFEIIDSNLRQRADLAFVVPARPGRTGVTIQPASRVDTANAPVPNSSPQNSEGGSQLHKRSSKQIKALTSDQIAKQLPFGQLGGQRH